MKISSKTPPREFRVGRDKNIVLRDCGDVQLAADEQVTFVTTSGTQYDVARKDFGYYATPSLNGRLPKMGLRPAFVRNPHGQYYILLVETGLEDSFHAYLESDDQEFISWLDDSEVLEKMAVAARNNNAE